MNQFEIGQKVLCIDDLGFNYPYGETVPVRGCVYTIREIDEDAVRLEEIINPRGHYLDQSSECCFLAWRFKPVVNIEVFQKMLAHEPA